MPGLSWLVHELTEHGFPLPDEDPHVVVEQVAAWLDVDVVEGGASGYALALIPLHVSARTCLPGICCPRCLIRNRKKIVGGFTPRQAHRWEVHLSAAERSALEAVEAFVRDGYARADRTNNQVVGFVMVIFQKLMASSIQGASRVAR